MSSIRHIVAQIAQSVPIDNTEQPHYVMDMGVDGFLMSMPMDFGNHMYSLARQTGYAEMGPEVYPHMLGQAPLDVDVNQLDWWAMNWSSMNEPAGQAGPYPHMPVQALFDADTNQLDSSSGLGFGEWPPGR